MAILDALKQTFFLPNPVLTEKNLPSQAGRVFIVTGGYAGIGKELTKILYSKDGTIYVAGRSASKADEAISAIKRAHPDSKGRLEFLELDLADLTTIAPAAKKFQTSESRLDVLDLNAGVMKPPKGSVTKQDHELQLGTNCLGSYLLMKCLLPTLKQTAATAPTGSVRVTWAASLAVDAMSPSGGIVFKNNKPFTDHSPDSNYGQSKVGNLFLAIELARREPFAESRVISNSWNPGNLKSELQRHLSTIEAFVVSFITFPTVFGAYTELWAGWGEDAGMPENNGKYVWPWGRFGGYKADVQKAIEDGNAAKFWDWCDAETKPFYEMPAAGGK